MSEWAEPVEIPRRAPSAAAATHRDPKNLGLAPALHARHLVGVIEELGLGQLVERGRQVHASLRQDGPTTDGGQPGACFLCC